MIGIILVGGMGKRLQGELGTLPKPMAPIGDKPFLDRLLFNLNKNGFKRIVLCTGYNSQVIKSYFSNKYMDIDISYSHEETPIGTGGAIKRALSMLGDESNVFILNGDTFFDINFKEMHDWHKQNNFLLSLALKKMYKFDRYGCINIDENKKIIQFNEKKYLDAGLINGGIYLTSTDILPLLPSKDTFSFENDFLEYKDAFLNFGGYESDNFFIDIGIPEDYKFAREKLK
jgi:D-glycero-alpha-D-manno-heptose 1-phosphate guanylyltransferase